MHGVDAAVSELRRDARLCGVIAPAHARVVGIGGIGVMAVGEFSNNQPHAAKIAARHHGAHVAHQCIARIAVVDRADAPCLARETDNLLSLGDGHRHRLLAQHVEARLEEFARDLEMRGVGCRNRDKVDPVRPLHLARQHLTPVAIAAIGCKAQPLAERPSFRSTMIECSGHESEFSINRRTQAVGRSDLAAIAAADHAPVQLGHRKGSLF